jgi:hypothetical protein
MDVARTARKRAVLFAAIFFAPPQTSTKKDFRCHHSRTFEYKQKLKCYSNDSFLIYQIELFEEKKKEDEIFLLYIPLSLKT